MAFLWENTPLSASSELSLHMSHRETLAFLSFSRAKIDFFLAYPEFTRIAVLPSKHPGATLHEFASAALLFVGRLWRRFSGA